MQLCETTSLTVEKRKKNVYNKKKTAKKRKQRWKTEANVEINFQRNALSCQDTENTEKENHKATAKTCKRTPNEQEANSGGARGNGEPQLGEERRNTNQKTNSEENS